MINKNIEEINNEIVKLSKEHITMANVEKLALLYGSELALKSILKADNEIILSAEKKSLQTNYESHNEYFPSLKELQKEYNTHNFQKVCIELEEFCVLLHSMIQSQEDKNLFGKTIQNINRQILTTL